MRTKKRNEELYLANIDMIRKKAWSYQRTSGIEFDELMSEGDMIFMTAIEKWDGKRPFSTFLWVCLDSGFRKFIVKVDVPGDQGILETLSDGEPAPSRRMMFREILEDLSKEALEVVTLILGEPAEALGILGNEPPKMIRGAIQRYLVHDLGMTHRKSWEVMRELKAVVA